MHGASQFFLLLLILPENNRKPEFSDAIRGCKVKKKKWVVASIFPFLFCKRKYTNQMESRLPECFTRCEFTSIK